MIVMGEEHNQDPRIGIEYANHNPFILADVPNEGDGLEGPWLSAGDYNSVMSVDEVSLPTH